MKSDISYPLTGQSPTTPLRQPTACYKKLDISQLIPDREELFRKKAISKWDESEIREFMMSCLAELNIDYDELDFNFGELKKQTGMLLLERDKSWFSKLSSNHGNELYQKFVKYRDLEERKRQRDREMEMYSNNLYTASYTLPFETPPHHQTPTSMEISAPHEFKYLPYENNSGVGSAGTATGARMAVERGWPTAALKPFPNLDPLSPDTINPDTPGTPEEPKPEVPKKRGPGRPRKPENELKKKKQKTGRLWEFIRNLLLDPVTCPSMVRWENHEEGMFRFVQAEKVAKKWGDRKKNGEMNYEKLSRAMRYYYKTEIFEAVLGRRLVYKFGKNAKGWRSSDPNFLNYHHATHAHALPPDLT